MKFHITPSVSVVIVALILSVTGLLITRTFSMEKNYATVYFDGGYKVIGIINGQDVFTKVRV